MNIEKIYFTTEDGAGLVGLLHKGRNKTEKIIISVHGMTSDCLKKRDDIIAKKAIENNIDYFSFNNRGHDVISYIPKEINGEYKKEIAGTAYEDVLDSYFDIKGAIMQMKELGYDKIYLQGHSLGCTKIVYTYNKLKEDNEQEVIKSIAGVMLLSLVDIPRAQYIYLGDKYEVIQKIALEREMQGKQNTLMPDKSFIHSLSVKSYLRYFRDNEKIDFARYSDESYDYKELNNITVPLFMRWGNVFEMIEQKASDLVKIVDRKISNPIKDIDYIDGANHGYSEKEEIVAEQMINFVTKL